MNRPFAVFDIDGTLIRWQLYHALSDELVRMGVIDAKEFTVAKQARMTWKKRRSSSSFSDYETALITIVDRAIIGMKVADFDTAIGKVIAEYQDQVYTYTRDLISDLKTKNYLLFTISASPSPLVAMIANHYGFDDYRGSKYATNNGEFTGKKDVLLSQRKPEELKKMVTEHQASWDNSIAVGDSESDIPMLESVTTPIAFNPTKALFDKARAEGWKIVIERKNMVYELEPQNGSLVLA